MNANFYFKNYRIVNYKTQQIITETEQKEIAQKYEKQGYKIYKVMVYSDGTIAMVNHVVTNPTKKEINNLNKFKHRRNRPKKKTPTTYI